MAHSSYYPAYTASEVVASTSYSTEDASVQAMSSSFYSLESYATQATASGGYQPVEPGCLHGAHPSRGLLSSDAETWTSGGQHLHMGTNTCSLQHPSSLHR